MKKGIKKWISVLMIVQLIILQFPSTVFGGAVVTDSTDFDVFLNVDSNSVINPEALISNVDSYLSHIKAYYGQHSNGDYNGKETWRINSTSVSLDPTDLTKWHVYDHYDTAWYADGDAWSKNYSGRGVSEIPSTWYYAGVDDTAYSENRKTTIETLYNNGSPSSTKWNRTAELREHIYTFSSGTPSQKKANMIFYGYYTSNYADFLYYPATSTSTKTVVFDVDATDVATHSLKYAGFLINAGVSNGKINGYLMLIEYSGGNLQTDRATGISGIYIYKLTNVDVTALHLNGLKNISQSDTQGYKNIATASNKTFWKQSHLEMTITKDSLKVTMQEGTDGSLTGTPITIFDINSSNNAKFTDTGYGGFGPYVDFGVSGHTCDITSSFQYTNLVMNFFEPVVAGSSVLSALDHAEYLDDSQQRFFVNVTSESENNYAPTASDKDKAYLAVIQNRKINLITDESTAGSDFNEDSLGDNSSAYQDVNELELNSVGLNTAGKTADQVRAMKIAYLIYHTKWKDNSSTPADPVNTGVAQLLLLDSVSIESGKAKWGNEVNKVKRELIKDDTLRVYLNPDASQNVDGLTASYSLTTTPTASPGWTFEVKTDHETNKSYFEIPKSGAATGKYVVTLSYSTNETITQVIPGKATFYILQDTVAPTVSNVTVNVNSTTGEVTLSDDMKVTNTPSSDPNSTYTSDISSYGYVVNDSSQSLAASDASITWVTSESDLLNEIGHMLNSLKKGSYYLHVLMKDAAGNLGQGISNAFVVNKYNATVTVRKDNQTWTSGAPEVVLSTSQYSLVNSVPKTSVSDGVYSFNGITEGTYYVWLSGGGYTEKYTGMTINTAGNVYVDFYTVVLSKDNGIDKVSGEGNYLKGEGVTLNADTKEGYHWKNWTQSADEATVFSTIKNNTSITSISRPYSLKANTDSNRVGITVNKDGSKWNNVNIKLVSMDGATTITDLTVVPNGTYKIYVDNRDSGKTTQVLDNQPTETIEYYTVTYKANNGTNESDFIDTYISGETVSTRAANTFNKNKWYFTGWDTVNHENSYNAGGTFQISGMTVLYAQWKQDKQKVVDKRGLSLIYYLEGGIENTLYLPDYVKHICAEDSCHDIYPALGDMTFIEESDGNNAISVAADGTVTLGGNYGVGIVKINIAEADNHEAGTGYATIKVIKPFRVELHSTAYTNNSVTIIPSYYDLSKQDSSITLPDEYQQQFMLHETPGSGDSPLLQYRKVGSSEWITAENWDWTSGLTLTGLEAGKDYEVKLTAENNRGTSDNTTITIKVPKTQDASSKTRALVVSGVSEGDIIQIKNGNTIIDSYKVKAGETSHRFENLSKGNYTVVVNHNNITKTISAALTGEGTITIQFDFSDGDKSTIVTYGDNKTIPSTVSGLQKLFSQGRLKELGNSDRAVVQLHIDQIDINNPDDTDIFNPGNGMRNMNYMLALQEIKKISNQQVGLAADVTLWQYIWSPNTIIQSETTQLLESPYIMLTFPLESINGINIQLYVVHEGTTEALKVPKLDFEGIPSLEDADALQAKITELTRNDDTKTFWVEKDGTAYVFASKYSVFAFTHSQPAPVNTGDNSMQWTWTILMAISSCFAAAILLKKKKQGIAF